MKKSALKTPIYAKKNFFKNLSLKSFYLMAPVFPLKVSENCGLQFPGGTEMLY